METATARPVRGEPCARFAAACTTLRALTCIAAAALLASCGGGDETTPATQSPQDASMKKAQRVLVPTGTIPGDAGTRGMWSPVVNWPLIAVHTALLPDGRLLTYGTRTDGQQTGFFGYDVWDPQGGLAGGHLTLDNGTGTDIFCSSQTVLPDGSGVFIAGGDNWTGSGTTNTGNNNSNLFSNGNNTLTRGPNMNRARWYSSSITLLNGDTYVQGGSGGADFPEVRTANGNFRLLSSALTRGSSGSTRATSSRRTGACSASTFRAACTTSTRTAAAR